MEPQNIQHAQVIEIHRDVHDGETSNSGSKICGEAPCGLADVGSKSKDAKERSASMRKLLIAVVLCVLFMAVEVVGGIEANSLAILTDAAHLLSDVAAFAISLFSLWAAGWEATPRQSYGFFRIEILGALVSIQLIWLLAGILVYEAIIRMIHNTGEVNGFLMFLVAAFGLVVNIAMAILLGHDHGHGHGHGHDHGDQSHGMTISAHHHHHDHAHEKHSHGHGHDHEEHSHDHEHPHTHEDDHEHHRTHEDDHEHHHTPEDDHEHHHTPEDDHEHHHTPEDDHEHHHADKDHAEPLLDKPKDGQVEKKQRNINLQGAYLHVLGDSVQSIGVMIGGAIIWVKPEWTIVDLICTLIFSVVVLGTTIKMMRNILDVLMESTPREIDATRLETGLLEMDEVVAVHELHIWAITVGKVLLACHVKVRPEANADMVLEDVIAYIRREYNISHVTIQIER